MQNKKVIILIVLSVFAAISLIHGIMAKPKSKYAPPAPGVQQPAGIQARASHVSMQRHARRTKYKTWNRNPFAEAGSGTSSTLVLNGIIWSKDKPKAMIGDTIVTKGSVVNGNKVIEITPNKVVLNDGVNNFELKMKK